MAAKTASNNVAYVRRQDFPHAHNHNDKLWRDREADTQQPGHTAEVDPDT